MVVVRIAFFAILLMVCSVSSLMAGQSGNLLTNPGNEKGSGGVPDTWQQGNDVDGVEYIWHATEGHNSKRSLCLKKTAQRYFPIAGWSQTVPYKGSARKLSVSAYIKARQLTKAVLDVQFEDANGGTLGHQWVAYIGAKNSGDPAVTHGWKQYSGTVDIPEGTKQITIAPQIYGPGVVWFDDLDAHYVP